MRLKLFFLFCFLLFAPVTAPGFAQAGTSDVSALAPYEYAKTCNYFRHRANALRVRAPDSPFVQLGDSCAAALERLKFADVYFRLDGRAADQQFLKHLTKLKRTVIAMNVARFREGASHSGAKSVHSISETGQYLIAKRLGIFEAHAAWQFAMEEERLATADQLFDETGDAD